VDLRKVTAGQKLRIPVDTWNTLIDAAQDYQRRSLHRGSASARELRSTGIVLVKNTSGQDCFRYDILGLDDATVIIDPETSEREFCQRIVLPAVTPADQHKDSFCILQEPIKAGKFGQAMLLGVTQCWVDVKAASDTRAEPAADTVGNLVSAASGIARIIWKQAGTGIKLAIVRLGGGASAGYAAVVTSGPVAGICSVKRLNEPATDTVGSGPDIEDIVLRVPGTQTGLLVYVVACKGHAGLAIPIGWEGCN